MDRDDEPDHQAREKKRPGADAREQVGQRIVDRVTLGDFTSKQGIFFQGVNTINVGGCTNPYDVRVMSVAANQIVSLTGFSFDPAGQLPRLR